jgi:hypothetical protein
MIETTYLRTEHLNADFRTQAITDRANTTGYTLGQRVIHPTFDGNIYECVTAGTSAGAPPTFNTNIGDTTVDGTVTWLTLKPGHMKRPMYWALFTAAPTEAGGGTEVVGGSYARVAFQPIDANWNAPSSIGDVSNKLAITWPSPSADWGTVVGFGPYDRSSGGNLLRYFRLTQPLEVKNGDPAPSLAAGAVHLLDGQLRNPGLRTTVP